MCVSILMYLLMMAQVETGDLLTKVVHSGFSQSTGQVPALRLSSLYKQEIGQDFHKCMFYIKNVIPKSRDYTLDSLAFTTLKV